MGEHLTPQERNTLFEKMDRKQKRLHILQEAIWQIEAKHFLPQTMTFFETHAGSTICSGCALGGMLVGLLTCTDRKPSKHMNYGRFTDIMESLLPYFSKRELAHIEAAYEIFSHDRETNSTLPGRWGLSTGLRETKLMIAIFQHIIKQDGKVSFQCEK